MALKLSIVEAKTNEKPFSGQLIGRYLAYYIATVPLLLGIPWVGTDKRKQGWHNKLAGTIVIKNAVTETVQFESQI